MDYHDLRDWIERVRDLGELRDVREASWQEDIGRVTEMLHHTDDSPAVLFDDIPGYPSGFRILANANATRKRLALTLGLPVDIERRPLMDRFLELTEQGRALAPHVVKDGPVMENVLRGDAVDVLKFPSPQWHPLDGGRYLGTGVGRDRPRGRPPSRQESAGGPVRRVDRLLRVGRARRTGARGRGHLPPRRPNHPRRPAE